MKILIDIGHPAHVHYFHNFIKMMENNGHHFLIIARKKEIIQYLLDHYNIPFYSRDKGKDSRLGKLLYMFYANMIILRRALLFKPDMFMSFCSPYAAQVSFFLRKPHICLGDTEHADKVHKKFTYPFTDTVITPFCYQNDLGKKHIKMNCVIESLYLHQALYKPDDTIYKTLGIDNKQPYVILRFVSWKAFHDVKQHGIPLELKHDIIQLLKRKYKIFISSEGDMEPEFERYAISIPPEKMHDALAFASLFITESGTMASESTILGTPVIYINSLPIMGYLGLEQEKGLLKHFTSDKGIMKYLAELLKDIEIKEITQKKRDLMTREFINPTRFLIWFIENYPESSRIMKENPEYQNRFK